MYCKKSDNERKKNAGSGFTGKVKPFSAYLVKKGEFTSGKTDHWNLGKYV